MTPQRSPCPLTHEGLEKRTPVLKRAVPWVWKMTQQIDDSTVVALRSVRRPCLTVVTSTPRVSPSMDAAEPDAAEPDAAEPDAAEPDAAEPDAAEPDAGAPNAAQGTTNLTSFATIYSAPFTFVHNAQVNRARRSVPLLIDDAAELSAVGRALELVSGEGGFEARLLRRSRVEARICLSGAHDAASAAVSIRACEAELLERARAALPINLELAGPLVLELLSTAEDALLLSLRIEAPAAQALESALHGAALALAPALSRLAGVRPSVRVTCASIERIHVSCRVDVERLSSAALAAAGQGRSARSAEHAIYRATAALVTGGRDGAGAAAHNEMIASGVAAVALALGNAPGRVFADAELHAARDGGCLPLCNWRAVGDAVQGDLELPLRISTHGRWRAPEQPTGAGYPALTPDVDIALLAACVGMACSLVALEDALRVRVHDELRALPQARGTSAPEPDLAPLLSAAGA
jgi:Hydroxymethylglutaryl-coenzyme A reductase